MQVKTDIEPAAQQDSPTVIVAEDEVLLRMALADCLRVAGFHVLEAANADEARKIAGAVGRVDLVISDVHMAARGEGIELARWIGLHYPHVPVILTSGSAGAALEMREAAFVNVTDFVPKPYVERDMERLARARLGAKEPDGSLRDSDRTSRSP